MTHKHHIIPRHMGGSDDKSNLVELSVEEHADAHRKLFEQYGKHEDFLAWKGLSGEMKKETVVNELRKLGGKIRGYSKNNNFKNPDWQRANNPRFNSERQSEYGSLANSPNVMKKKKEIFLKIKHQQGKKNSQFGTAWITDGISNKKIRKDEPIPEGWRRGRV